MNRLSPLPVLTLLFASLLPACQPSALNERDRRNEVDDVVDVDDGGTDLEGCGDGAAADGEVCDSGDVRGGTCAEFGFTRGTLGCQADCAHFDFSGCEEPLSACAGHVCQNGGSCVVVAGAPACACHDGFEGAVCEQATAPSACETIICSNGGLCGLPGLEDAAEPSCDCTPFFSGDLCDDPVADPRGDGGHEIEFYFRWQADDATRPVEHLPEAVSPPEVDVGGDTVILPSGSAAQRLLNEHRIVLDDEELAWDDATATRCV